MSFVMHEEYIIDVREARFNIKSLSDCISRSVQFAGFFLSWATDPKTISVAQDFLLDFPFLVPTEEAVI